MNSEFEHVCRFADRLRRRLRIPGAAVGLLYRGRLLSRGFGVSSAAGREAVTGKTLFQIGSVSKTFTALLILKLRREGRLDLDRPIALTLKRFRLADKKATRTLTLRHIMTHRGGWAGDYFDDTGRGDGALADFVARLGALPQLTPVGTVWAYNNSGFCVAGQVIEAVTGMSFEAAMERWVFRPLGLKRAFFFVEDVVDHPFAVGHDVSGGKAARAVPWALARSAHPAGGIVTDLDGLLRFAGAHFGGESVSRADAALLFSHQGAAGCGIDSMGLAWMRSFFGSETLAWHGGATNGQGAQLSLLPRRRFAFAALANAGGAGEFVRRVEEFALARCFGLSRGKEPAVPFRPSDLELYRGTYEAQLMRLRLVKSRGGIVMRSAAKGGFPRVDSPPLPSPPPVRLESLGEDRVRIVGSAGPLSEGEFLRAGDGTVAWLRLSGRLHAKKG